MRRGGIWAATLMVGLVTLLMACGPAVSPPRSLPEATPAVATAPPSTQVVTVGPSTALPTPRPTSQPSSSAAASPTPQPTPTATAGLTAPDGGGRIAFARGDGLRYQVYIMNADGSGLTPVPGIDSCPAWSPDGMRIAYSTYGGPSGCRQSIYIVDADGLNPTFRTCSDAHVYGPAWSPDGTQIAYTAWGYHYWDIHIMNVVSGGGGPSLTGTGDLFEEWVSEDYAAWSPDGTRIAFSVNPGDGNWEIFVVNVDGSGLTGLGRDGGPCGGAVECTPSWKHEGYLALGPGGDRSADWSPDGTRIAFVSTRDGNVEIYVMNADGSGVTRLTDHPGLDDHPTWSPDGRRIAFKSDRAGRFDIFVMSADGRGVTSLTNSPTVEEECPDWSPR